MLKGTPPDLKRTPWCAILRGRKTSAVAGVVVGDNDGNTALHYTAEDALRYAQKQYPRTAEGEGVVAFNLITLQTVAG